MRYTKKHNIYILSIILFVTKVSSQTITPYVLNMGGGYSDNFLMEWSIGESASIGNFLNSKNGLNTGVLQPKNLIRKETNINGPTAFGSQITIYPNLTPNIFYIKGNFVTSGNLKMQLIRDNTTILNTHDAGLVSGNYEKSFSLAPYPDGIFYIKVYFKPNIGNMIIGIYKVIKVSN